MKQLARFIREHRERIIREWLEFVKSIPGAEGQSTSTLRDHVPLMLDELARALDADQPPGDPLQHLARVHARERFRDGYDLRGVVFEYQALRRTILRLAGPVGPAGTDLWLSQLGPIDFVIYAIDRAVADVIDEFLVLRDRARDIFVGILGHDLRTPLQTMLIALEALLMEAERFRSHDIKLLTRARNSTLAMSELINDVLDFARGRLGGSIPISPRPTDLDQLLREVVNELSISNPDRKIRYARSPATDLQGTWDPARVRQVVVNLLNNAIAHGDDPIVVDADGSGDQVTVTVTNRGDIPQEAIAAIFEPMARGEHAHEGGLGLGLFIVRSLVRGHGGEVSARSNAGETIFTVSLPRHA